MTTLKLSEADRIALRFYKEHGYWGRCGTKTLRRLIKMGFVESRQETHRRVVHETHYYPTDAGRIEMEAL